MKVALIGITGNVGSRLAAELLARGHHVTGIARNAEKNEPRAGLDLTNKNGDVLNEEQLIPLLQGHDAVIHSVSFTTSNSGKVVSATKAAGVKRLLVVGGAGSLEIAPGLALVHTPEFPDEYKPEALAGLEFLNALRAEPELDWTFLSPSAFFLPGERTQHYRLGTDQLLVGKDGKSQISFEDFAVALVNELETPAHSRQRFTVGY